MQPFCCAWRVRDSRRSWPAPIGRSCTYQGGQTLGEYETMARSAFARRRSIAAAHGAILTVGVARGNEENSGAYAHGVGRRLRSPDGPRATRPRMMAIAATCASAFDGCDENFSREFLKSSAEEAKARAILSSRDVSRLPSNQVRQRDRGLSCLEHVSGPIYPPAKWQTASML
jgi:hypothetical protein